MNISQIKKAIPRPVKELIKQALGLQGQDATSTQTSSTEDPVLRGPRTWVDAQKYELDSAIEFMKSDFFRRLIARLNDPDARISLGHKDELMLKEFFANDDDRWQSFVAHIAGKYVLEIGPCVASQLSTWDVAARRYVIEPLYEQIADYQRQTFGMTAFRSIDAYARSAEELIAELVDKIDGAILIRNCIDHSPQWPFILSNVASYAARGAYLLLWNDLFHAPGYEEGHYDITRDYIGFRRLIENLGFNILLDYQAPSVNINYGCLAVRS